MMSICLIIRLAWGLNDETETDKAFNSYIVCPIVSLQSYAAVIIVHYNYSRQEIWESELRS